MDYTFFFFLCDLEDSVFIRVKRIGGTILRVEQQVRKVSQRLKGIHCLKLIKSERESKLKSPWIKQN